MTSERGCHRMDMRNAAFVKMRDSVSFCKQILIEYVLEIQKWDREPYIAQEMVSALFQRSLDIYYHMITSA